MKNRAQSFSLFSFLILLFSQDFLRLAFAAQHNTIAPGGLMNTIRKADFLSSLKLKVEENSLSDIRAMFSNAQSFLELNEYDLLPHFLAALDHRNDTVIDLFLTTRPNLVHYVMDQGTLAHKKSPPTQIAHLTDGRILQRALELGADANNVGNTFPLRHAVLAKMWSHAAKLLEHGATANILIEPKLPLIKYLAEHNQTQLAIKIISSEQFLDKNQLKITLFHAMNEKQNDLAEAIFKREPNLENQSISKVTPHESGAKKLFPIHLAVTTNNSALVDTMKKMNFNLTRLTKPAAPLDNTAILATPLTVAVQLGLTVIFDQLISFGVDPTLDESDIPPLFYAAVANNTVLLSKLLSLGCDANPVVNGGRLLDYRERFSNAIIDMLIKNGARQSDLFDITLYALRYRTTETVLLLTVLGLIGIHLVSDPIYLKKSTKTALRQIVFPYEKRDEQIRQSIQSLLREFYSCSIPVTVNAGTFTLALPLKSLSIKNPDANQVFEIPADKIFAVISRCLNNANTGAFTVNLHGNTLTLQLTNPKSVELPKLNCKQISTEIQSNLQQLSYQLPEYEKHLEDTKKKEAEIQRKKMMKDIRVRLQQCRNELPPLLFHIGSLATIALSMQKNLDDILIQRANLDWTNKRLQKPRELLQREIDKFNAAHCATTNTYINNALKEIDSLLANLTENVTLKNLTLISQRIEEINSFSRIYSVTSTQYQNALNNAMQQIQDGIDRNIQDSFKNNVSNSVAQSKELKKTQLELEAQRQREAQLQAQQENAEKKRQFRLQQEEQRRIQAEQRRIQAEKQERRRVAELKRQEELRAEQASRAQTTSASTSQLTPIVQEKVITIGDLLQRSDNENHFTEHLRVQYRYALLAQCLRLFEITGRFLKSKISNHIRNTLMHQHHYFDLDALRSLGDLIAHRPVENPASTTEKFEDILDDLQLNPSSELNDKLSRCLMSLSLTNFYGSYIQKEYEPHSAFQFIRSIQHGLEDLSKLNEKLEQGLAASPDKILAIQGILMCIGEAYQQLLHLNEQQQLNHIREDLLDLLRIAINTREKMGHQVADPRENEGLYLKFLNQSSAFAQEIAALLEPQNENSHLSMGF